MKESVQNIVVKNYSFPSSKIEFWNNGIVYIEIQPNTEVDLEISKSHYQVLKDNFKDGAKYFVLVEPGKYTTLTKEAREFAAKPETNEMTNSVGVIIHSLAQRIIINFHSKFISRQKVKMKGFQTKELAMAWLLDQKRLKG